MVSYYNHFIHPHLSDREMSRTLIDYHNNLNLSLFVNIDLTSYPIVEIPTFCYELIIQRLKEDGDNRPDNYVLYLGCPDGKRAYNYRTARSFLENITRFNELCIVKDTNSDITLIGKGGIILYANGDLLALSTAVYDAYQDSQIKAHHYLNQKVYIYNDNVSKYLRKNYLKYLQDCYLRDGADLTIFEKDKFISKVIDTYRFGSDEHYNKDYLKRSLM